VREIQLLLRLLAERVYSAQPPLRDASDFQEWLVRCSDLAGRTGTVQEFFDKL
jgi:hypothetical protein